VQTLLLNEQIYHKTAYKIYGFVDDDPEKAGKVYDGVKVLGNAETLVKYASRLKADEVILAIPEQETMGCKNAGCHH
jgi:FlaA1/EpsC-like NDP-sugar epimerase